MFNHEIFAQLEYEAGQIFSWSVEPHLAFHKADEGLTANVFYEKLYVNRVDEDREFLRFLQSDKTILIITGHVGVGKSTFIREKYQHRRFCVGITVDLKQRQTAGILEGDLATNLQTMIAHAVKDRLLANFRDACARNRDEIVDPAFDIAAFPEATGETETSPDDHAAAELRLASFILARDDFLKSDALSGVRSKYGADVPIKGLKAKRQRYQENLQRTNVWEGLSDVYRATRYREWLRCYQLVFEKSLPLLVVIDNSDVLDTKLAGGKVYEPIVEMEGYLNHWDDAQLAGGYTLPNIKFVFAVRDENIALINTFGRRPQHALQISLGPEDISIPYIEDLRSLSTTDGFISQIIEKRLHFFASRIKQQPQLVEYFRYFRLIFEWWFEDDIVGVRGLSTRLSKTNIISLNNRSIAQIMEHICQVSLQMLQSVLWCNISMEDFDDELALTGLRGRVFRAAWAMNNVRKLSVHWASEFERKTSEPYISLSRLLLTRLVNQKAVHPREGRTVRALFNEFQAFFPGLAIEDIKGALYALYESSVGQSELIAIQQGDFIAQKEDIHDESKVFAMLRGNELLDKIFIQIDFFGEMLADRKPVPKNFGRRKTLMEMAPSEAVVYVSGIYKELVIKISRNYVEAWRKIVCPALSQLCPVGKGFRPFEEFRRRGLTYNNAFYIERCCDSHRGAIKRYLLECLRPNRIRLFIPEEGRAEVVRAREELATHWTPFQHELWTKRDERAPDDQFFSELLSGGPSNNNLVKLWKVSGLYADILESFRVIKDCKGGSCKLNCSKTDLHD